MMLLLTKQFLFAVGTVGTRHFTSMAEFIQYLFIWAGMSFMALIFRQLYISQRTYLFHN